MMTTGNLFADQEDADNQARIDAHNAKTSPPLTGLRAYSTAAMYAEIARRRNARVSRGPILKCDECQHFVFFSGDVDEVPKDYNACSKRHVMVFREPDPDDGPPDQNDDWGFYRKGCKDRETGYLVWPPTPSIKK